MVALGGRSEGGSGEERFRRAASFGCSGTTRGNSNDARSVRIACASDDDDGDDDDDDDDDDNNDDDDDDGNDDGDDEAGLRRCVCEI